MRRPIFSKWPLEILQEKNHMRSESIVDWSSLDNTFRLVLSIEDFSLMGPSVNKKLKINNVFFFFFLNYQIYFKHDITAGSTGDILQDHCNWPKRSCESQRHYGMLNYSTNYMQKSKQFLVFFCAGIATQIIAGSPSWTLGSCDLH